MDWLSKESTNVAIGVLIAVVVLALVRNFLKPPAAPVKHANGAPYIPGQVIL